MKKHKLQIGSLSNKSTGSHFNPPKMVLDVPTRITNSSSRAKLVPTHQQIRAGGEAFLSVLSRGERT